MKRSLLCAGVLAGAFIAIDDAAAVETTIGDTTIELVAPTGYCPLDRSGWPEFQLMDFTSDGIKQQGERLAYFVACERARSWHQGGSSKDGSTVDYQASPDFRNQNVTRAMLQELCTTLRMGDDSNKGWFEIFLRALKGFVKGKYGAAEETTLTYVVLGFEDTGCHLFSSSVLKNRDQVYTASLLTMIKSKAVTVHVSRKFGSMDLLKGKTEDVIKDLLETSQGTATGLISSNP